MVDFIQEPKEVKSRKIHKCSWCGLDIQKGETYETSTLKYDGLYTWKAHLKCRELTEKLDMFFDIGYEGLTSNEFHEHIWQWWRDVREGDDEKYNDISWEKVMEKAQELLLKPEPQNKQADEYNNKARTVRNG